MLYRASHKLSLRRVIRRFVAALAPLRGRVAEQDLAALSPHLLRDLGLLDAGLDDLVGRK